MYLIVQCFLTYTIHSHELVKVEYTEKSKNNLLAASSGWFDLNFGLILCLI